MEAPNPPPSQAASAQAPGASPKAEVRLVLVSLLVGAVLMAMKLLAYSLTKSAAIFSDAMENVVNLLASGFATYAVLLAHRPADKEHPYGHGKIEFMSAGFEGGMMLLASLLILARAVESLAYRQPNQSITVGIVITAFSAVLCAATGLVLRRKGADTGSMTLQADGTHLLSDALTSVGVLAALAAVRWTGKQWLDPLAAIAVSIYVFFQASLLLRRSAAGLMDEQEPADTARLERLLDAHIGPKGRQPLICSYHKVRHRHSGRHHWVDFHIQVPARWDVEQGHRVATAIEMEIERELGQCSASAHVEPCLEEDCPNCQTM
jgi:cation diffusion facilitator family transporter